MTVWWVDRIMGDFGWVLIRVGRGDVEFQGYVIDFMKKNKTKILNIFYWGHSGSMVYLNMVGIDGNHLDNTQIHLL